MWAALAVVAIAVGVWAWWLAREPRAPRQARWGAPLVALATAATSAYGGWGVQHAWSAVADVNPAERQERLSSGLASAYTAIAIGWAIAAVAIVVLTCITLRRRGVAR